jgi:hypothetical protein
VLILERPWTRQPQGSVGIDWSNPLARDLKNVFCESFGTYDIASGKFWSITGSPPASVTYNSRSRDFSQSLGNSYSQLTTTPPAVGWTLACVITPVSYPGLASFFGFAQDVASATYDRQLQYGSNSTYIAQIYDGNSKTAPLSPVDIAVGAPNLIVLTCTSSTLTIHIKGTGKNSASVDNSGYTGYTTPTLVIGKCNNKSETSTTRIPLLCRVDRPWSDQEVSTWFANPWQLFAPLRIPIPTPAAAASAPTITALSARLITATSAQPRISYS